MGHLLQIRAGLRNIHHLKLSQRTLLILVRFWIQTLLHHYFIRAKWIAQQKVFRFENRRIFLKSESSCIDPIKLLVQQSLLLNEIQVSLLQLIQIINFALNDISIAGPLQPLLICQIHHIPTGSERLDSCTLVFKRLVLIKVIVLGTQVLLSQS